MTDGSAGCDKLIWSSSTHPICVSVSEETERPYSGSPMSLLRTRPRRVWFMWRPGTAHTCCPTARWSPSHGTRRSKQIICVFFTPSPSGRWILNCFLWCLCPEATCAQTRWCAWSPRASARGRGPSKSKPGPFYAACATCQVMNCSQKHCEIRFLHALFLFCVRDLPQMSMMVKEKCPWGQSGCGSLSQQSLSRVRERPGQICQHISKSYFKISKLQIKFALDWAIFGEKTCAHCDHTMTSTQTAMVFLSEPQDISSFFMFFSYFILSV